MLGQKTKEKGGGGGGRNGRNVRRRKVFCRGDTEKLTFYFHATAFIQRPLEAQVHDADVSFAPHSSCIVRVQVGPSLSRQGAVCVWLMWGEGAVGPAAMLGKQYLEAVGAKGHPGNWLLSYKKMYMHTFSSFSCSLRLLEVPSLSTNSIHMCTQQNTALCLRILLVLKLRFGGGCWKPCDFIKSGELFLSQNKLLPLSAVIVLWFWLCVDSLFNHHDFVWHLKMWLLKCIIHRV